MASLLLNSLNDACQAHRHVVFNKDLNDGHGGFERAGKRHAIALFFGAASAKEKNQLTLMKIKEAFASGMSEGGRFCSSDTDAAAKSLFAPGGGDRRISSNAVNLIIRAFRQGGKSDPAIVRGQDDMSANGRIPPDDEDRFKEEAIREFCGCFGREVSMSANIAGQRIMFNAGLSPKSAYEMVSRLSRLDLSEFSDGQLKDLATLSWNEMDRLNAAVGFEIDGGKAIEDLYAEIMTPSSVLKRLIAYPELMADAATYRQASGLMEAFDGKVDALIREGATRNLKASTKWMLERFVFQDLAMQANGGKGLPDVRSFSDGFTSTNRFVRFAETMFGRSAIPWNMLCLSPELRVPVMAAMDAYGEYQNQYLLTRLIANGERVCKIYSEGKSQDGTMTKEQAFRAINGDDVPYHPLIHENADYWNYTCESEYMWTLNEKGVDLTVDPDRYKRKLFMVNDFIQRYALSKEYVMGMAFQEDETAKASFQYTKFSPVNAPVVVNDIGGGFDEAIKQFGKDFDRTPPGRYEVKFTMPDGDVCFSRTDSTRENTESVVAGVKDVVMRMCGTAHSCQAEVILMVLSQALEQDLYAAFASFECDPTNKNAGLSKSFSIARNEQDGSVSVHITDMGNSALKYDWSLKINTDGTQVASDMTFSRNLSVDAPFVTP